MRSLDFKPIEQTGHNCKIVAITAIDNHYARLLNIKSVPLHKAKMNSFSIRQLAKRHGSVQGELLEINQIQHCLNDLGYENEILEWSNVKEFKQSIEEHLAQGNLIIGFFAVHRWDGAPSVNYENNEHAAVIHQIYMENIEYTHWSRTYQSNIQDFFDSSKALPTKRLPEYYQKINDRTKKYELVSSHDCTQVSITPKDNSGFRCKLVVVKKPELRDREAFMKKRQELIDNKWISKKELEVILNQYETHSWWRKLFSFFGWMNKESYTILELKKLLNTNEYKIGREMIKNQILHSSNHDSRKSHRALSLFNKCELNILNSSRLNTDEVIEKIKKKFK